MNLFYNGLDLATMGELSFAITRDYEGANPDAPQRCRVTMKVAVTLFEDTFADNFAKVRQMEEALTQQATLKWADDETNTVMTEQTAALLSSDLPENESGWQEMVVLNLVFQFYDQKVVTNALPATFRSGASGSVDVSLGSIGKWAEGYTAERYSPRHAQRSHAGGMINASGLLMVDTLLPLADRRAALMALKTNLMAQVNGKDGTLTFGDFNQVVRVTEFRCDVDQPNNAVAWTLSATFTRFPNESDYALVEFSADQKETLQGGTGEQFLTVSGKISAPDSTKARTKLGVVRSALLAQYGYSDGQQLRDDASEQRVEADADGEAFLELSFTFEYRRWRSDNQSATYQATGEAAALDLGQVNRWSEEHNTQRYSEMRDQRSRVGSVITATGTLKGNMGMSLAERRAALLALKDKLTALLNTKSGALVYGTFTQTVRVEKFSCEVNQALTGIDWALTAGFTRFPNESNYATAEFQVVTRDEQDGQKILSLTGKVMSHSVAGARAKLDSVRTSALNQNGFTASQPLRVEQTENRVAADSDGEAFIELAFNEEYRGWSSDNQSATLTANVAGATARSLGNVNRWSEGYVAERFNGFRSHRSRATGKVTASGTYIPDGGSVTGTLVNRRKALLKLKDEMLEAVNAADATLVYGEWNKVVRVTEFTAEVNQALTGIDWNLSVDYTRFPSEADYSTAEFTTEVRDPQNGELMVVMSGRIQASSLSKARSRLLAVREAVLSQNGAKSSQILRQDETASYIFANGDRTKNLDESDTTFVELSFTEEYRSFRADNQQATFTKTGSAASVALGNVRRWVQRYNARRFSDLRSHRQHSAGVVDASGTWLAGDLTKPVATRRTELMALVNAMRDAFNGKDGTLVYGADFNQVVRVEEFSADINQAISGIDWSLSATWSLFPNEAGYALAEFEVQQREAIEDGELFLSYSGLIRAPDETSARAKLATLRTSMLGTYGYASTQQVRVDSTARGVSADVDGDTFIELSFSEEYRKRRSDEVAFTLRVSDREDFRSGIIVTTYSGAVTAGGASEADAYFAALAKAEALGANKYPFIISSQITFDQRQTRTTNGVEFLRLEFTYEYQRREGALVALELGTETSTETFGLNGKQASGYVAASDYATAKAFYDANVKPLFAGLMVRSERLSEASQSQVKSGTRADFWARLDFQLAVHSPKAAGAVKIKYAIDTTKNFATLDQQVNVSGSVFAASKQEAEIFLNGFLGTLQLGSPVETRRTEDVEYSGQGYFLKLDFSDMFQARLSGEAGIVECNCAEDVQHSGVRWVERPLPDGASIFQNCGTSAGRRTVRASATAATDAVASAWCKKHRAMLTGTYESQPEVSRDYQFLPRTDGVVTGDTANFKFVRVTMVFTEFLPSHPFS